MRKTSLLGSSAICTAALGLSMAFAAPAVAQTATNDPSAPAEEEADLGQTEAELQADAQASADVQGEEITVTGSRIRRPNLESTVPITSVGAEQVLETGQVSVGDQLNQLPQLRATFSQANSTRFIGTAGQNFLDLRGLGTERTLVLVNSRRFVSTTPGSFRWDVNNVPADLVERVDVVTGGNSAIYGSDAVAGVVNFILKRSFDGLQLRGQAGISDEGDSSSYFVSGIAGRNFADGRGNITVAAEYARQEALYIEDRAQGRERRQFQLVQNLGPQLNPNNGAIRAGGEPSTGDGIPDTAFIGPLRRVSTSTGGTITASCPVAAAAGESAAAFAARRALTCSGIANPGSSNALSQFGNAFAFLPNGTLVPNGCQTDFRGFGSGNCLGGLGSTLRESGQFQPELNRINATVLGRFQISEALTPFFEAQYTRVDAVQEGQPTFGAVTFNINNPFLTDQARAAILPLLAPGATTFSSDRQNLDFGARGEDHERETMRLVGGIEGDFNDDWHYEIAANYGRFTSYYETEGNFRTVRFQRAAQAVRNAAGQIVCAVNADAITTNDDPACVPVNLFGRGNVSQEALNYFGYTSSRRQKNTQFVTTAFMSGDSSDLFELPGGPIGFAVGGEYRREKQRSEFDPVTAAGETFLNLIPLFDPPTYTVKEAFGEIRLPLLREQPFFHELTIEAAGRVSDYNVGLTGTVFAWNAGITWAPVRDLRLRAAYQKSVRAPTLGDLFTSPTQTFNNAFNDPCGQQNINNNPNRVKNCAAAGVPTTQTFAGTTEPFTNRPSSGVAAANRGNPNLREERGTSYTLGAVFQPSFVPGFSLSVDYYNIEIKDVIFTLGAQTVLDQCYDNPSGIDNPFCAVVTRLPNGTLAGQRTVFQGGNIIELNNPGFSSLGQPFNYARQKTSGIDVDANYRRQIGAVELRMRGIASYLINRDNFTDITQPSFINRQKSEIGDPEWRFQLSTNLEIGKFNFGHRVQYIGKQILGGFQYETFFPVQGRPPLDPDAAPFAYYPAKWYHDFRLEIDATERFQFYMGIDNAFDTLPPLDLLGTEGGSLYDPTGRFFYAGAKVKF
jgi:outer membrane receptor protein involved in Fe transport